MRQENNIIRFLKVVRSACIVNLAFLLSAAMLVVSCSTTKTVPENDQLYIGLKKIDYQNYENSSQFATVQEEVEASLATAPNGALFGSSYYRTIPYRLWIWNTFSTSNGKFGKWMTKTFGKAPVLMSQVNPELRSSVAQTVMRNHGYLYGNVDFTTLTMKNPKKAKIGYTVDLGHLFTVDSMEYVNFPAEADSLINVTKDNASIKSGSPFDASMLDSERSRIATLFRNNGYYYYQSGYASYLADTIEAPGKAQLRLQLADNIPEQALHKWYIRNISLDMRKEYGEELTDSFNYRFFTVRYNGKRPPLRPRVILRDLKMRSLKMYRYDDYMESYNKISGSELFSMVEFNFTPKDTTATCDSLDLNIACTFGKPYDFYLETNFESKINGRTGPQLVLGFTRRNAFRGGEKIDINLHGSYEWESGGASMNSYEYGIDGAIEFPRLIAPFVKRRLYYSTPYTYAKLSANILNRPGYFKMNTFTAEWSYKWQRSVKWQHEFSPLTLQYQKLSYTTAKFDSLLNENPYMKTSMQNVFIPKMKYTLTYSNSKTSRNPIVWSTTFTEASNILSLFYMAAGNKWGDTDKQLLGNSYAQFLKVETDLSKTWQLDDRSQLIAHANAGVIYTYGNSRTAPYSEQFYVGGANSIRAFAVRSLGPGRYHTNETRLSYLDQTGDIKLQLNLEYRFNIFGDLYGAAFLDAGNVWSLRDDADRVDAQFKLKNLLKEMALGTGIGIRYDLEFLVIRLDWGIGLHVPYETGKGGFYNINKFKDGQALHLAIGYPF